MESKTPVQMTDDLARFVKESHEDVALPHESLYVDLLEQWKVLSNYQLKWADDQSKKLYNAYWKSMARWYHVFDNEREDLLEPSAMPSIELVNFYSGLISDLEDHVLGMLPEYPHEDVISLTDFRVLLSNELHKFIQLDLEIQGPIDIAMTMDYWKLMGDALDRELAKK